MLLQGGYLSCCLALTAPGAALDKLLKDGMMDTMRGIFNHLTKTENYQPSPKGDVTPTWEPHSRVLQLLHARLGMSLHDGRRHIMGPVADLPAENMRQICAYISLTLRYKEN